MLLIVVAPIEFLLVAGTLHQWQCAGVASFWLHADALTLFLALEAISVALTSPIPKSRTAAVFAIKEPLYSEVPASSSFFRQRAHRRTVLQIQAWTIRTTHKSWAERNRSIAATAVRRAATIAACEFSSCGHRFVVWTAAEF